MTQHAPPACIHCQQTQQMFGNHVYFFMVSFCRTVYRLLNLKFRDRVSNTGICVCLSSWKSSDFRLGICWLTSNMLLFHKKLRSPGVTFWEMYRYTLERSRLLLTNNCTLSWRYDQDKKRLINNNTGRCFSAWTFYPEWPPYLLTCFDDYSIHNVVLTPSEYL
jgi:hypothetical protein